MTSVHRYLLAFMAVEVQHLPFFYNSHPKIPGILPIFILVGHVDCRRYCRIWKWNGFGPLSWEVERSSLWTDTQGLQKCHRPPIQNVWIPLPNGVRIRRKKYVKGIRGKFQIFFGLPTSPNLAGCVRACAHVCVYVGGHFLYNSCRSRNGSNSSCCWLLHLVLRCSAIRRSSAGGRGGGKDTAPLPSPHRTYHIPCILDCPHMASRVSFVYFFDLLFLLVRSTVTYHVYLLMVWLQQLFFLLQHSRHHSDGGRAFTLVYIIDTDEMFTPRVCPVNTSTPAIGFHRLILLTTFFSQTQLIK